MFVDYSDSDDEPAAAAAAPPPKKAKKEISLQALHAANNVSAAPSDVPAGLPAGFFDSAADAAADAPPPAAAAASAPKKGLLSFLPPPVNAPKAPAKGGASAYARAQPLKRPPGAAAAASAPGPSAAPRVSAAPDVGAAASVVRPRVDPSLYADAVGAAPEEESVTDAYPGGDDGFTDAYPDAGSYGPSAGGGGGYDVPLGPMAAADDGGAAQRGANSSFLTHMERHMDSHAAGEGGMVSVSQDEMRAAFGPRAPVRGARAAAGGEDRRRVLEPLVGLEGVDVPAVAAAEAEAPDQLARRAVRRAARRARAADAPRLADGGEVRVVSQAQRPRSRARVEATLRFTSSLLRRTLSHVHLRSSALRLIRVLGVIAEHLGRRGRAKSVCSFSRACKSFHAVAFEPDVWAPVACRPADVPRNHLRGTAHALSLCKNIQPPVWSHAKVTPEALEARVKHLPMPALGDFVFSFRLHLVDDAETTLLANASCRYEAFHMESDRFRDEDGTLRWGVAFSTSRRSGRRGGRWSRGFS